MSGRRLGRLLGSLFVLAALVAGASGFGFDGSTGDAQTQDYVWH
ncbi:hypothetical protein GA0074695_1020 [Micromonospora viridifaciens]|uniref:Uncharacterized protein n=1 Tax=Micromonospora viridifaciens TaxID=1881 RepID=A0A1C4V196_MICVI|nr:hypothetical protein GA0074695_1020 [Micromonospora viridifaciens]